MVFWNFPRNLSSSIQPAQVYTAKSTSSTNRDVIPAIVKTAHAVPFWNKLRAEIVNALSAKPFDTHLDSNWLSLIPTILI